MGSSFRWMLEKDSVLQDLSAMIDRDEGAVAFVSTYSESIPDRLQAAAETMHEILERHLTGVPHGPHPGGRHDPFAEILARSPFPHVETIERVYEVRVRPTIESLIGAEYSTYHVLTRLGDRRAGFEQEVRAALADFEEVGEVVLTRRDEALIGRRSVRAWGEQSRTNLRAAHPCVTERIANRARIIIMLPNNSIFLAGIPATGKSSFGNWLEEHKGYLHLDFDEEALVQQQGFGQEQQLLWQEHRVEPLLKALLACQQPIVLNWGFALHFLPIVTHMFTWGFVPVWFTAARRTARQAFIQRGGIDVKYFDQYMALLTPMEQEIISVFGHHVLQPLQDDGTRLHPSEIYTQVLPWLAQASRI